MAYLILGLIIGIIIVIRVKECYIALPLFGIVMGAFLWITVGACIGSLLPTHDELQSSTPICSLKDSNNNNGSFILGCGSIEENLCYYYIIETDKGKKVEKIEADEVYLKETDKKPSIDRYEEKFNTYANYLFAHNCFKNGYIVLNIPRNTIIQEYKIDLE